MATDKYIAELRSVLAVSDARGERLYRALRQLKERGLQQRDAYAALKSLRGEFKGTAVEDEILDTLDYVVGWCSPEKRIWPDGPQL
jgi:hypothetical protein